MYTHRFEPCTSLVKYLASLQWLTICYEWRKKRLFITDCAVCWGEYCTIMCLCLSVCLSVCGGSRYVTRLWAGPCGVQVSAGGSDYLFSTTSIPAVGHMELSNSMGTGCSPPVGKAVRAWGWPLTSIVVLRLRMSGSIPTLSYMPSWRVQ